MHGTTRVLTLTLYEPLNDPPLSDTHGTTFKTVQPPSQRRFQIERKRVFQWRTAPAGVSYLALRRIFESSTAPSACHAVFASKRLLDNEQRQNTGLGKPHNKEQMPQ